MPVRKVTRSTRSTRTTKASSQVSSSSDLVLDENIDASGVAPDIKVKSSKPTAASNRVLGERNAPNDHVSSPHKESSKSQSAQPKVATQKSTKSKKGKKAMEDGEVEHDSRATTPVPAQRRLPEEQVQQFLQSYDLEAQARLARLRASLEMSIQSAIGRMRLTVERIPRAVRELQMGEFIDEYDGDIHVFMNRAPVQHLKETQEEWDQIREERSPAKAKRSKKDDDATAHIDRNSKSARTINSTASTSRTAAASAAPASKRKAAATRSTKASSRSTSAAPTSPPPSSAASSVSSKPAPSLSTFQPSLPKEALQTPKPRMARPGEMIQWQSINGSPICGIIGADGMVRPVSMA